MAASDNGNSRRQRRRSQLKPQPVPSRQEISRTSTNRPGSSKGQGINVPRSRRLPTPLRQNQLPNREGLNWWQQIFGQTSKRPISPARRLQRNKLLSLDNISQLRFDRTRPENRFNLSDLRSARSRGKSSPIAPLYQTQARRNKNNISSRYLTRNLTPIATNEVSPSKIRNLHPSQKKRKSLPVENSAAIMQGSLGRAKSNSASRQNLSLQQRGSFSPLLYSSRLLILGIGLSVVIGTLLSIWSPAAHKTSNKAEPVHSSESSPSVTGIGLKSASTRDDNSQAIELRREITSLKTGVQAIASQYPQLNPGIFVLDIDTGAYLDWNGDSGLPAASTIKVPILLAFFQDVDAGKIRLDEKLTLEKEDIASGSGQMQYKPVGTQYTALETATQMIIISDNSATNMLIARLGGAEALNQRFREWGLQATTIQNKLPDIEGTNITSAKELASLMARVNQGELVSLTSRDRLLDIMQRTQNRSLLPKGLGKEATIAHKTGNIGSLVADVGLIDLPSGKRYIAAVMVKRPRHDVKAAEFINKISRLVYQHFSRPVSSPKLPSEDSAIPANSILSPNNPDDRSEPSQSADARNGID